MNCVSLGKANPHAVDRIAQSIVPKAIHRYGRRYTDTRRTISHVVRGLAASVGSSLPEKCGW
jgi:hypothetical protein